MNTQTKGKIEEAAFFLDKFRENYNNDEFRFYLSAFLSAARSIIWVMNSEFNKDPLFIDWYSKRKETEEEKVLFKRFNELRVTTTKQKPIETHRVISSAHVKTDNFKAEEFLNKMHVINISGPDKDGKQFLSVTTESGNTFEGEIENYSIVNTLSDEEDLLALSEKYLDVLVKIYNEWMQIKIRN